MSKAYVISTLASIYDFETSKTVARKYWFKGYADGKIIFAEDPSKAAVVSEQDAPALMESLRKKDSIHTFEMEPAKAPITWEQRRLRSPHIPKPETTRKRTKKHVRLANQQA